MDGAADYSRPAQLRPPARGATLGPGRRGCWHERCRASRSTCPQPAPTRVGELFAPPVREVWLEIGFGGGEHLLWQARAQPRRRASSAASRSSGRRRQGAERHRDGAASANIRLHRRRRPPLLRWLPGAPASAAPSSCFPIPGRRSATRSAGSSPRADPRRAGSRDARRAPSCASRTDIGDYARWMLLADARRRRLRLDRRRALPTGASGPPIGRRPATSRRP